jgi:hypothetical protein
LIGGDDGLGEAGVCGIKSSIIFKDKIKGHGDLT